MLVIPGPSPAWPAMQPGTGVFKARSPGSGSPLRDVRHDEGMMLRNQALQQV
jgi:hypothetical protein